MLILHFTGIGNGVLQLPLLKRLEEAAPGIQYYHVHNPVFDVPEFVRFMGLKNLLGTVPARWRRCEPRDWDAIRHFIESEDIDVVVNLRNEGPERDRGIAGLREMLAPEGLEFWELDQGELLARRVSELLVEDHRNLFLRHGIDLGSVRYGWLRDLFGARPKPPVTKRLGLFTGSSTPVKRWRSDDWIELGRRLLSTFNLDVVVFAGSSPEEREAALGIHESLAVWDRGRCHFVADRSLFELCERLDELELVVGNDTACIHIAAALDLPAIGLYFSTRGAIWGGASDRFIAIQSDLGPACGAFKWDAGNCRFFYGGCPAPCRLGVTPQAVYDAVANFLDIDRADLAGPSSAMLQVRATP